MTALRTGRSRWRRERLVPSLVPLSILESPFQWVVGIVSMILGAGVVVTESFGLHAFTRTQVDLPLVVACGWGGLMLIGGGLLVHAMRKHVSDPARWTAVESAALMLLGAAWTVFGVSPFFIHGAVYSTAIVGFLLALACLMRILAIVVSDKITREAQALHREVR